MTQSARPQDHRERERILCESVRNVSVQAGAGTGKTTLMVERVIRLVQMGIPLERLAAVTFTDAAAAELRLRIRNRLSEEASAGDDRCLKARGSIASSWISTIHGFASRLLKEYFNLSGVDPAFTVTESHFTPLEIDRDWNDWLLRLAPGEETLRLLSIAGSDVQGRIALGIESRRWLTSNDCVGDRSVVKGIYGDFMASHGRELENILSECSSDSDKLYSAAREFLTGLNRLGEQLPFPETRLVIELYFKINLNCGSSMSWSDKERAKTVIGAARDRYREIAPVLGSGELTELTWDFAGGFARMLREKWDKDGSRLSYGDLLHEACRSISGSQRLSQLLRERFDHILIDEFQDTSREQAELFKDFLSIQGRIPPGRLTIVADDKQSIYGWRNADIETYNSFRAGLEEDGALIETISTNFRSSVSIIRFINSFGRVLFDSQSPEEEPFGCRYSPIFSRPGAAEGESVRVMKLPAIPDEMKNYYSAPSWSAQLQATWFAGHVGRGILEGNAPEDYALLFRSGTHVHHFVDALEREGIPYRMSSARDFLRRQEVVDLRELIKCLIHPGDRLAWVHTLRSLFFGLSDITVDRALSAGYSGYLDNPETGTPEIEEVNRILRQLRDSLLSLPLADFLMELVLTSNLVPVVCAGRFQVARRLGNIQYLLEQTLAGEVTSPMEMVHLLDEDLSPSRMEEPSSIPVEGGAVTLSSIHSSKGLAWKHVVIAASSSRAGGGRDDFISYDHGERAAFSLGLSLDDADKIKVRSPYWPWIRAVDKARNLAETRRLLYVAVTRAMDSLTILAEPSERGSLNDASILWQSLSTAGKQDPGSFVMEELGPDGFSPFLQRERRDDTVIGEPQPSFQIAPFTVEPRPCHWQSPAARLGDQVHRVMEKIDFEDPESWFAGLEDSLQRLFGDSLTEIRKLCSNFFRMDLPFELAESVILGREYPYSVMTPGGMKKRYVDLLLRTPEGMLTVIDYKTDNLDAPGIDEAITGYMKTQRHYIRDMSVYFEEPVRGYLVFLRHGTFMRVETDSV